MSEAGVQGIAVGRRVRFEAGYGNIGGDGVIVDVRECASRLVSLSNMTAVRYEVDVILDDGRRLDSMTRIDQPGIGIKLLPEIVGADEVMAAKQRHAVWVGDQVIAKAKAKFEYEQAEAARVIPDPPLFYWNGIKDAKGAKLQKCSYSEGRLLHHPECTITIYARDYIHFSAKVRECFAVENDTDSMADYFDSDRIRVIPAHPLYPQVKAALEARDAHYARKAVA